MKKFLKSGFTLVEIMMVIGMIGILATVFYSFGSVYLNRARDMSRFTALKELNRGLDWYQKDKTALPSNYKNALDTAADYCVTSVFFKRSNASGANGGAAYQFEDLKNILGGKILSDPLSSTRAIDPCDQPASYIYINGTGGDDRAFTIVGARMAIGENGNYSTGSDISNPKDITDTMLDHMQDSYKGTIKDTRESDGYYFLRIRY